MRLRWAALIAAALLAPHAVDAAWASAPPSKVVAELTSEKGVLAARCARGPERDKAPTYLCTVKVRQGCILGQFQYRRGVLGWYRSTARVVACWKTEGGPTS